MSLLLQNRILKAAEQKVESGLTPDNRADYLKIVVAGMKIALDGGPNSMLASLKQSKTPIQDCVTGAVNLCLLMRKQSRGTMPLKAMVPAGMTLLIQALDFADRAGVVKVGNPELVQAAKLYTNQIFKSAGITAQMLHTAAGKIHAITQDPSAMEKINRAAGIVKDPNASTPTEVPEASNAV